MVDGAGRRRRGRAQRPVRCGRAAGCLRQPHHGDKRRVQGEHQRRVSGGKCVPLRALRGARNSESGRADHGGQAHAVHARQPLCRNCGLQKNRRPANQEAGAPATGRLRRNADCAEHISGNMNQKSN